MVSVVGTPVRAERRTGHVEFHVLGPVEVCIDGTRRPLRPRATLLLAVLIRSANRAVPTDTLADRLWAGEPPRTAASALRVHLSDLRAALRPSALAPSRL